MNEKGASTQIKIYFTLFAKCTRKSGGLSLNVLAFIRM